MSKENKQVENMKPNEHPFLEDPGDFDPAKNHPDEKYGGGGKDGKK